MKKYRVILADPPWSYRMNSGSGVAENHYNVMAISDICALPIEKLADDDSVLLMWGTWPLLPQSVSVISAWGFEYVSGFPWIKIIGTPERNLFGDLQIKPQYGIGFWVRGASEFVLIGKRGNARPPLEKFIGLLSENFGHSRKPENLYEYAELFDGPYLELFARRRREGWDAFGNEVEGSITL